MTRRPDPLTLMRCALGELPERPERVPPEWWWAMAARARAGRASVTRHASGVVVARFDALPGETLGMIASTEPEAVALASAAAKH